MENEKIETLKKTGLTEETSKKIARKLEIRQLENIINDRAKYTEVNTEQQQRIDDTGKMFSTMYNFIEKYCKNSRETSLAITKLEEAQMWVIKGITREVEEK